MSGPDDRRAPPPTYTILPTARAQSDVPPLRDRAHDRTDPEKLSGWIELRLTTIDHLHMGSGVSNQWSIGPRDTRLVRDIVVQRFGDGEAPVIPGASLKGAVRSIAEALGGGCDLKGTCSPPCAICALFGHLLPRGGYLGRVGFGDAHPVDRERATASIVAVDGPMPREPKLKKGRRIYRGDHRWSERPVLYAAVKPDVSFTSRLNLHNVTHVEAGLVLLAAGADGSFRLRIGGGKFGGFGRIRTEVAGALLRRDYRTPKPTDLGEVEATKLAQDAMKGAMAHLPKSAQHVLEVLQATPGHDR
ncbi:RAMP superfamily CRISPR-associated protein [Sorangium sp. So ce296]|uniref:RAMP superfamily CRISPR-associated protein n=1 Tax=Sorangium sp. So ce296 TaxID=3133296 RepID=UPI003F5DB777